MKEKIRIGIIKILVLSILFISCTNNITVSNGDNGEELSVVNDDGTITKWDAVYKGSSFYFLTNDDGSQGNRIEMNNIILRMKNTDSIFELSIDYRDAVSGYSEKEIDNGEFEKNNNILLLIAKNKNGTIKSKHKFLYEKSEGYIILKKQPTEYTGTTYLPTLKLKKVAGTTNFF